MGFLMVGSISSMYNSGAAYSTEAAQMTRKEVETLVKYVNGESLEEVKPDTFMSTMGGAVGTAAVFEGIPLANYYKRSKALTKLNSTGHKAVMDAVTKNNQSALKNLVKGTGSIKQRLSNFMSNAIDSRTKFQELRSGLKGDLKLAQAADKFANNAKYAKKVSKEVAKATKNAAKASEKAAILTEKLATNPNSKKLQKAVEKATKKVTKADKLLTTANLKKGVAKAAQESAETVAKAGAKKGILSKMFKSSGAGLMVVFSGISETISEVIPTFKELGVAKGLKQTAKSAVKVVGDTVGFVVGEQAGVALGTAIGTAICPGIGTAVGAVCGFIGGMLGSFVAGKVTKSITGPTEREKAKEEATKNQVDMTMIDGNELNNLKNAAIAKIQETQNTYGKLDEDAQKAYNSLINLNYATV